jgi:hypothetical protein
LREPAHRSCWSCRKCRHLREHRRSQYQWHSTELSCPSRPGTRSSASYSSRSCLIQSHRSTRPQGRKPISAFLTFPPQYAFSHTKNSVAPLGGALRCQRRKIWEERTVPVPISRAYMRGLSTDQNTTPHIKRRENQRDTQLSVVRWYLRRQSQKHILGLSLNLQTIRKALGRRKTDFLRSYLR